MLDETGIAAVEEVVRRTATEVVVPLFGALATGDIEEKAPGDLVTVADKRAEEYLTRELTRIVPGSKVVGEEGVHADPDVLDLLQGPDPVWVIDPVDGTEAFATGSPRFSIMVGLAQQGRLLASWIHAPVLGFMATGSARGAFVDGEPLRVAPAADQLRHLDLVLPRPRWWPEPQRPNFHALFATGVSSTFFDYAGLNYVDLAAGRHTVMLLPWEAPWDHAAGVQLHEAAGGVVIGMDGNPFQVGGGNALPMIAAPDRASALLVRDALLVDQ
ncbi:inositol monophosphatase [Kineosporia rhizophila]|uniref:inositol monophosphatase family protein n=1 Tax=Kineosporia TaxID=49184 RepID=UPI001E5659AD|nr:MULTISPECIES: inositol monophosphatase [Kineosporia]MCE0540712.1 inositol monophosphatase [Kineosporia rhizophila]GLY18390.1 inositol monophosphatase [Kineosporia sp. NBRC 101677]